MPELPSVTDKLSRKLFRFITKLLSLGLFIRLKLYRRLRVEKNGLTPCDFWDRFLVLLQDVNYEYFQRMPDISDSTIGPTNQGV